MLTPIEIQSKSFKGGIGYVKKDVEDFMNILSEDYSEIYKENKELKEQLKVLANTLSHYRAIENEMNSTLELAKKASHEIKEAAHNNAKQIEEDANNKVEQMQKQIVHMLSQHESFKERCLELTKIQIEILNSDKFNIKSNNDSLFADIET